MLVAARPEAAAMEEAAVDTVEAMAVNKVAEVRFKLVLTVAQC